MRYRHRDLTVKHHLLERLHRAVIEPAMDVGRLLVAPGAYSRLHRYRRQSSHLLGIAATTHDVRTAATLIDEAIMLKRGDWSSAPTKRLPPAHRAEMLVEVANKVESASVADLLIEYAQELLFEMEASAAIPLR